MARSRFAFLDQLSTEPPRDEFGMPILDPNTPIADQTVMENPGEMARVPTRAEIEGLKEGISAPETFTVPSSPLVQDIQTNDTVIASARGDDSAVPASTPSSPMDASSIGESPNLPTSADDSLSEAQRQRREAIRSANMDRGIDYLLKGYATGKGGQFEVDEVGYKAKIDQAGIPVTEIDEQFKATQSKQKISLDDLKNADAKSLSDPNSSVSKAYRDYAKTLGANVGNNVPASQLETLRPLIEKQASLEEARMARAENRADRALDRDLRMKELSAKTDDDIVKLEKKEVLKEDREIKKENRKTREQLNVAETGLEKQLRDLEETQKMFKTYSKGSIGGTGPLVTIGGATKIASAKTQMLDSAFKGLNLDTMSKLFAGMSRAVDSDAERRAFEAAQPSLSNDDEVNENIFKRKIEATKSLLEKTKRARSQYDKFGDFAEQSPQTPQDTGKKQIVKRDYSPSRDQTRVTYSDGSVELLSGKQKG